MKKTISLLALAFVACISISAQTQQQKVVTSEVKAEATTKAENYAEIKFDTLRHDFGKFSKEDPVVNCSFKFTNVGTAPLVIHQAFASCGCTIPTYNGRGKFPGHFQKTVTVRTNSVNEVVRLTIEGTME